MKYGNCFTGAVMLLWTQRDHKPRLILRTRPGTMVPHFMVKTNSEIHHYKVHKEILPWPLCYFFFEGRFQTVPDAIDESF
jgi:hypothetical protein